MVKKIHVLRSLAAAAALIRPSISFQSPNLLGIFRPSCHVARKNTARIRGSSGPDGSSEGKIKINFVTGNQMKIKELRKILEDVEHISVEAVNIDLRELQDSPEKITKGKVLEAAKVFDGEGAILVEDTALCFNALNGLPGPYVKWFLQSTGCMGLYNMLQGFADKTAVAQTTLGYMSKPDADPILFIGQCRGEIVAPRGDKGGWDPVFQPAGWDKTFAEMTADEKNSISHRSNALQKFKDYLRKQQDPEKASQRPAQEISSDLKGLVDNGAGSNNGQY